jgi:HEAT repeat protein
VLRLVLIGVMPAMVAAPVGGGFPVVLDGTDAHYIGVALRGIKMTTEDLSYQKDHADPEFVLAGARQFLRRPLALPLHGQRVAGQLREARSLAEMARFVREQLEVGPVEPGSGAPAVDVPEEFLRQLPAPVARAVSELTAAAGTAARWIGEALPPDGAQVFGAFSARNLRVRPGAAELAAGEEWGLEVAALRELLRRADELELHEDELERIILEAGARLDAGRLLAAFVLLAEAVDRAVAMLQAAAEAPEMRREFEVQIDTPLGKIICGGAGRNVYRAEALLIIDTGGDDVYENSAGGANGLAGRPVSIVIDLAGNDQYVSRRSFSQGAGLFGIGILVDCGGDDVYAAEHVSQGAGVFGCGLLVDDAGHDVVSADTFCQGAGMFGAGVLWQRGGDTRYQARYMAQGLGATGGCGLLLDGAGNDVYVAGGKHPCPWLPGQYFSLAQGFGIGMRPFAGGGVGVLCDLDGDDRYVADVYGQGASYWYAAGMLLDAAGNDFYQCYQYCQGAGIHLSSGLLVDWAGDDQYGAQAICQGGAHDYAVGMLVDRGGNDRYAAVSTAQGSAINNSVALLLDRAGEDFYAGRDPQQSQAAGHDGGRREYGSIGLMLDLGGRDVYSQGQTDNSMWLKPWHGAGLDVEAVAREPAVVAMVEDEPVVRAVAARHRHVRADPWDRLERLLRRAISERPDAGEAWAELKQQGWEALEYLVSRLDSPSVMVRVRTEQLVDHLGEQAIAALVGGLQSDREEVRRVSCWLLARFGASEAVGTEQRGVVIRAVLPLLEAEATRPVALHTLGHWRAHEAYQPAIAGLADPREMVRLRAAQALGRLGDARAVPRLIGALDDGMWTVRYAAQDALVALGRPAVRPLRASFAGAPARARPHVIGALARLGDRRALRLAREQLGGEDALVREAMMRDWERVLGQ